MGGTRIDRAVYESVWPYVQAALGSLLAPVRSARQLLESTTNISGRSRIPYLKDLHEGIRQGRDTIADVADSAKTAVLGMHVTPEQRHQMISQRAFLRAEQRGFAGGHAEEDWQSAEQEVDALLARQAGIVERARRILHPPMALKDHG
jgi:hypothetical protein